MKIIRQITLVIIAALLWAPASFAQDGLFQAPWRGFDTGVFGNDFAPTSFAVGDLDGDGDADILVSDSFFSSTSVSVLKNNGDRTFGPPVYYALAQSQTVGEVALSDIGLDLVEIYNLH